MSEWMPPPLPVITSGWTPPQSRTDTWTTITPTTPSVPIYESRRHIGCCAPAPAEATAWYADAGVTHCVSRQASLGELWRSVETVVRDDCRMPVPRGTRGEGASHAIPAGDTPALTPREAQIVTLLDEGCSNKEIAARLAIAVGTVKQHVHNILSKLHADRRGVAAARMRGRV